MKKIINRFQEISSKNNWTVKNGQLRKAISFVDNNINNNSNPSIQTLDLWKGLVKMVEFYSKKETTQTIQWKKNINDKAPHKSIENSVTLGKEIDKLCKQQGEDIQNQKKLTLNLIEALKKAIMQDKIPESKEKIKAVLSNLKQLKQIIGEN